MSRTDVSGLSQLGQKVDLPSDPDAALLEKVPSSHAGTDFVVHDLRGEVLDCDRS